MDYLWLDTSNSRDTPYSKIDKKKLARSPPGDREEFSVDWDILSQEPPSVDYFHQFKILKPKCTGRLSSIRMERKCIEYAYEWFLYMTVLERDVEVFEAAVILVAAVTILEERVGLKEFTDLEDYDLFGYRLSGLLRSIGRVLTRPNVMRLKNLLLKTIKLQLTRQNEGDNIQTILKISKSYDSYMKWRNIDGYYEIAMLCSFAAMGESCKDLTIGLANDVLEAAILSHDTHSVIRHFSEAEIANCHRYLPGGLGVSINHAFKRVAYLRSKIRMDPEVPSGIKECAMVAISSCHSFNYGCKRYKFGGDLSNLVAYVTAMSPSPSSSSINPLAPFNDILKTHPPSQLFMNGLPGTNDVSN